MNLRNLVAELAELVVEPNHKKLPKHYKKITFVFFVVFVLLLCFCLQFVCGVCSFCSLFEDVL